nr:MAG TPA: hypothetical protein [Bacteriophage sp.]
MPAQKKTSLGLNQWIGSEYPKRIDFVEDNKIIDDELSKRVEYTDVATETEKGIVRIHSLDTVENQSNELQNMIANNLQSQVSGFIKNLNHDEMLTVKSLVKYLSKILKPATENTFGLVDYQTIKQVSPKPDLSPYIPFSKGYMYGNNSDYVVRANGNETWIPMHAHMYNNGGAYVGTFHLNGGKAYFKVPNRNGGNWCEIMDNYDMAARDQKISSVEVNLNSVWHTLNNDTVRDIRLVGGINPTVANANQATERGGYVVTGVINFNADNIIDYVQMRAFQIRRGGNGNNWYNVPFG